MEYSKKRIREEANLKVAKNLLVEGIPVFIIAKSANLSEKEIQELKE